jgi:hypothetical protein
MLGVAMDYPSPGRALNGEGSLIDATAGSPGTDRGVVEPSAGVVGRIHWAGQGLLLAAAARHLPIAPLAPITRQLKITRSCSCRSHCAATTFKATDTIANTGDVPYTGPSAAPNTATPSSPAAPHWAVG